MSIKDALSQWMPTFFKSESGLKSAPPRGALPSPTGGQFTRWWGDGTGSILAGFGAGVKGRNINYAVEVGDVTQNSAVSACLNWISTNWASAPVKVGRLSGNKFQPIENHPLETLLDQPFESYNGKWLMWALLADYYRSGNAYAFVIMGATTPYQVQYLPASTVTPVPDGSGHLLRYDYKPKQTVIPLDPKLVVHFRFGINPSNVLLGISPLLPVYDEIVSDNACARYPANTMHHGGLPPAILTPEPPAANSLAQPLTPEMAKVLTDALHDKMRNDPGSIPLLSNALKLVPLGWKPSEMALNDLREEPETRIAAQFGIPCITAGLRAGLIRSTYTNTEQAVQMAWNDCLVPLQKYFASEWTRQLLTHYGNSAGLIVQYDHTQVGALQEDQTAKRGNARQDYRAGILTHAEARAEAGRDPLTDKERAGLRGQAPAVPDDLNNPDPNATGQETDE